MKLSKAELKAFTCTVPHCRRWAEAPHLWCSYHRAMDHVRQYRRRERLREEGRCQRCGEGLKGWELEGEHLRCLPCRRGIAQRWEAWRNRQGPNAPKATLKFSRRRKS